LKRKLENLRGWIRDIDTPVGLGFSGGVDSAFLLAALKKWCRYPVTPFCLISPFLSNRERVHVANISNEIGLRPRYLRWNPFEDKKIYMNDSRRCYFCKGRIYSTILTKARQLDIPLILDGTQLDDIGRERPGLLALRELNIGTPLADCGMGKTDIRAVLRQWGYSFWKRESESCLATRIAKDTLISKENLNIIEKLEDFFNEKRFNLQKIRIINKSVYIFIDFKEIERIKMYFKEIERISEGFSFFFKI